MKRVVLLFLAGMLLLCLTGRAFAQTEASLPTYSSEANSGVRHEVCTSLAGTSVDTYYTGEYTFGTLSSLSGDALLQTLRTLMTDTHTHYTTYGDCRDLAVKTDCENGDGQTITLLYSSFVTDFQGYINNTKKGWNREHVWPVSLGGFSKNQTPGCDLHHIRPTDSSLNGTRGNDKYGYVEGGREIFGTVVTNNALGGKKGGGLMEPLDNVKGDVARICLYMYVRYGTEYEGTKSITNVFESIDTLLAWCELDPVDTWEMGRNEVVQAIQGNRNVFIDFPELAWHLFDREVPENMQTPGSKFCWFGHDYSEWRVERESTETTPGIKSSFCNHCQIKFTEEIPAWNSCEHQFGDWIGNEDGAGSTCTICGYYQWVENEKPMTWIWILVGIAAVGAAATVIIVIKKKKKA